MLDKHSIEVLTEKIIEYLPKLALAFGQDRSAAGLLSEWGDSDRTSGAGGEYRQVPAGDLLRSDHAVTPCSRPGAGAVVGFGRGQGRNLRPVLAQARGAGSGV